MIDSSKYKNVDRIDLLLKALDDEVYPETLFKYRGVKRATQILTDLSFRFSSPASFNDPFDCSLDEVPHYKSSEIKSWLKSVFSSATFSKISSQFPGLNYRAALNPIQQDKRILTEWVRDAKENAINSRGVLALSKRFDEILLWSHYAESQAGVAIELELRKDPSFFLMPRNMDYEDVYTPTNYIADDFETIDKVLRTKSSHWKYEDEVRIYKKDTANKDVKINPKAIKSVYFGIKANDAAMQNIMAICQNPNLKHVKFFKGEKVYGQFKINFVPVK